MRRLPAILALGAAAVVARMAFHAAFVPAFEGPDEPYHLARVLAFASQPFGKAFAGAPVEPALVDAVRGEPCAESLHRVFGCPSFGKEPARFNVLAPSHRRQPVHALPSRTPRTTSRRSSMPWPGSLWRLWPGSHPPLSALLFLRLLSVACVAAALLGPLRALARERPAGLAVAVLLHALTPGASEALARASNDAAVFLWAARLVAAIDRRRAASRDHASAAGRRSDAEAHGAARSRRSPSPRLLGQRRTRLGLAGAAATLAVFPVQALRGWRWGGTLEFNSAAAALGGSVGDLVVGLARSAYTLIKTTFWLGEWTFFRAPRPLVVAFFLLLAAFLLLARSPRGSSPRRRPRRRRAGRGRLGSVAFAVANRLYYGDWGGVGGWYVWTWLPWLALAASDVASIPRRAGAWLLAALAAFVLVSNAMWFAVAFGVWRVIPCAAMSWLDAIVLGVIQGLTEFIPVSSDGHLSAAEMLMPRFGQVGLLFDVLVHVGTLAAILIYYRRLLRGRGEGLFSSDREKQRGAWRLAMLLLAATIPTGITGLLMKHYVEQTKTNPRFVGAMEILTGLYLAVSYFRKDGHKTREDDDVPGRGHHRDGPGLRRAPGTVAIRVHDRLRPAPGLHRTLGRRLHVPPRDSGDRRSGRGRDPLGAAPPRRGLLRHGGLRAGICWAPPSRASWATRRSGSSSGWSRPGRSTGSRCTASSSGSS